MATIWSGSAAVTGAIRLRGGIKSSTFSCQSCTSSDVDNYDNDVYRDLWVEAIGTDAPENIGAVPLLTKTTEAASSTVGSALAANTSSADDRVAHIPPRLPAKKRTILMFWTTANGTGNVVASCWADEFEGFGPEFSTV